MYVKFAVLSEIDDNCMHDIGVVRCSCVEMSANTYSWPGNTDDIVHTLLHGSRLCTVCVHLAAVLSIRAIIVLCTVD